MQDYDFIKKIKMHDLDNANNAKDLYFSFCEFLNNKYGAVDKDYDENPTKRGKEWLDIHHISEYELDDIANKTKITKEIENLALASNNVQIIVKNSGNAAKNCIEKSEDENAMTSTYYFDHTLSDLKKYNKKDRLVYANKIEHFLLHYLIASIRGKNTFFGGPNILWDQSVELDIYKFRNYKNKLQNNSEAFYSIINCEEITRLYKKLIDWGNWKIEVCSRYWLNLIHAIKYMDLKNASCVKDPAKLLYLLKILGYNIEEDAVEKLHSLSIGHREVILKNGLKFKTVDGHLYRYDGKSVVYFSIGVNRKYFTVPCDVEIIEDGAFINACNIIQITIPRTVKVIENNAFTSASNKIFYINGLSCPKLKKIFYEGSQQTWNELFSNVILNGVRVVYKEC